MKILHISPSYKPAYIYGGPTMSISKLCEALVRENIQIQLLTTNANGQGQLQVETGCPIVVDGVTVSYYKRIINDPFHYSPALLKQLIFLIKNDKPQLLHIHSWWNITAICSCLIAIVYKVPVVLSPKGMLTEYSFTNRSRFPKLLFHILLGRLLLSKGHLHASTSKEQIDLSLFSTPLSITIIPNLIRLPKEDVNASGYKDPDTINISVDKDPSLRLVFMSRIEEKKGIEILMKALSMIRFNWSLSIAGSGELKYMNKLKILSQDAGIDHLINWVGQVNDDNKFQLLSNHDLLVLPSYNESFGNIIIESLAVGTAVLVSEYVGLSEYVKSNRVGWVSQLTVNGFKDSLNMIWQEKCKFHDIRIRAPSIVSKDFDDQLLVNKYVQLYKTVLNIE
jgi:glycosyltransferase involved in cell wall biosynthesis